MFIEHFLEIGRVTITMPVPQSFPLEGLASSQGLRLSTSRNESELSVGGREQVVAQCRVEANKCKEAPVSQVSVGSNSKLCSLALICIYFWLARSYFHSLNKRGNYCSLGTLCKTLTTPGTDMNLQFLSHQQAACSL